MKSKIYNSKLYTRELTTENITGVNDMISHLFGDVDIAYKKTKGACFGAAIGSAIGYRLTSSKITETGGVEPSIEPDLNMAFGPQFDIFLMTLEMVTENNKKCLERSSEKQTSELSEETITDKPAPVLKFYNDNGKPLPFPPRETKVHPPNSVENMVSEKYLAWRLRKWLVEGNSRLSRSPYSKINPITEKIILSQGFLYDPLLVAKLQLKKEGWGTPSFVPSNDCITRALAYGFAKNLDTVKEHAEYCTKITHLDVCCVASCLTISCIIHLVLKNPNALHNLESIIRTGVNVGIDYLPKNRKEVFQKICYVTMENIKLNIMPTHVYKGLVIAIDTVRYTIESIMKCQTKSDPIFALHKSYNKLIEKVINLTNIDGEKDSTVVEINCMIAGVIYGLLLGIHGIPDPKIHIKHYRYVFGILGNHLAY